MRIAIISITREGAILAQRLAESLEGEIDVFAKKGRNPAKVKEYEHLGQLISMLFHQYDGLVFIMSAGIVVRLISPHVRDKRYDPAVIVLDESGRYAISLLTGHLSGADSLAHRVGEAVDAQPIITTSAAIQQKPAIDILAVKINAAIEPFERLEFMNSVIENGEKVSFFIDSALANYETYIAAAEALDVQLIDMKQLSDTAAYDAAIIISDKELYMTKPHVFLRPATLVLGLTCPHNTRSPLILRAIADACRKLGRSMKSIAALASIASTEDEIGVLTTAQQIEVPLRLFNAKDLRQHAAIAGSQEATPYHACEAAALAAAKADSLLLPATDHEGVIIAIAEAKAHWWE